MDEMFDLTSVRSIKQMLAAYGLRPKHSLGQNFLVDKKALERILQAVDPKPDDVVLEIGPGPGVLTRSIAQLAGQVVSVELDQGMVNLLERTLADQPNAKIIRGDAMKIDLSATLAAYVSPGQRAKVAANLPYYITSPLIFRLLEEPLPLSRIVVMVQKEVADRIVALPGTKEYGALSVAVQYYTEPRIAAKVPRGAFWPVPEVDSAVVVMEVRAHPPVAVSRDSLFAIVRAAFGQRRKTLLNALSGGLNVDKERIGAALQSACIDGTRRGETLSLAEFAALAGTLECMNRLAPN